MYMLDQVADELYPYTNCEWKRKFPEVRFTDKVCVTYEDGTDELVKHLYYNNSRLFQINWNNVVECCDV